MTETDHYLFYYPHTSFTNGQLPLLKVAGSQNQDLLG